MLSRSNSGLKQLLKENYDGIVSSSRDVMQEFEDSNEFHGEEDEGFLDYAENFTFPLHTQHSFLTTKHRGRGFRDSFVFYFHQLLILCKYSNISHLSRLHWGHLCAVNNFLKTLCFLKNSIFSPLFEAFCKT